MFINNTVQINTMYMYIIHFFKLATTIVHEYNMYFQLYFKYVKSICIWNTHTTTSICICIIFLCCNQLTSISFFIECINSPWWFWLLGTRTVRTIIQQSNDLIFVACCWFYYHYFFSSIRMIEKLLFQVLSLIKIKLQLQQQHFVMRIVLYYHWWYVDWDKFYQYKSMTLVNISDTCHIIIMTFNMFWMEKLIDVFFLYKINIWSIMVMTADSSFVLINYTCIYL